VRRRIPAIARTLIPGVRGVAMDSSRAWRRSILGTGCGAESFFRLLLYYRADAKRCSATLTIRCQRRQTTELQQRGGGSGFRREAHETLCIARDPWISRSTTVPQQTGGLGLRCQVFGILARPPGFEPTIHWFVGANRYIASCDSTTWNACRSHFQSAPVTT